MQPSLIIFLPRGHRFTEITPCNSVNLVPPVVNGATTLLVPQQSRRVGVNSM